VDFHSITSTTSPDDALALFIAMYTIFKLNFNENSRTIRLIYLILHDDTHFLSNSIHILIKEKYIIFYSEEDQKQSTSSNSISNGPISNIQSQPLSGSEIVGTRASSFDEDGWGDATETQERSSENSVDSNLNIPINTNESFLLSFSINFAL